MATGLPRPPARPSGSLAWIDVRLLFATLRRVLTRPTAYLIAPAPYIRSAASVRPTSTKVDLFLYARPHPSSPDPAPCTAPAPLLHLRVAIRAVFHSRGASPYPATEYRQSRFELEEGAGASRRAVVPGSRPAKSIFTRYIPSSRAAHPPPFVASIRSSLSFCYMHVSCASERAAPRARRAFRCPHAAHACAPCTWRGT
ncbi:hypothetical protein HYPSUDRAFT_1046145 [Hypholoma sublateritium FD-334 SS-4]|uniref:Uncharacterized protein n=1 Tax=Hypholoma sublateritium (strain FD-334 SS-4) TaxID=945553 RepID=A0A0D2M1I4_HYPSF|nr:hypothetical protein HYPSUDRAFT_1046145 [Hypholoma sublateritium FD-334 SS-4]